MNDTKVISARVPLSNYVELLSRAKNARLSISDYIILTLFEDVETQVKREELIEALNKSIQDYRNDAIKANAQRRSETIKILQYEERIKALQQTIEKQIKNHNEFVDHVLVFVKEVDKNLLFGSYKTTLEYVSQSKWDDDFE